jgi:hypothetical protein
MAFLGARDGLRSRLGGRLRQTRQQRLCQGVQISEQRLLRTRETIQAPSGLAAGHALKDVCAWVNEIGIKISYSRLSDYVNQLRRAERDSADSRSSSGPTLNLTLPTSSAMATRQAADNLATHDRPANMRHNEAAPALEAPKPHDPWANVRRSMEKHKRAAFDYRPELAGSKKLI